MVRSSSDPPTVRGPPTSETADAGARAPEEANGARRCITASPARTYRSPPATYRSTPATGRGTVDHSVAEQPCGASGHLQGAAVWAPGRRVITKRPGLAVFGAASGR